MEALLMRHRSLDRSISPYKSPIDQNPRNIQFNPFISVPSENYLPSYFQSAGGLLQPPHPFLSHSYPPYSRQLPPLLPLPAAAPLQRSGSSRGFSSPKKTNRNTNKDPSFTPKKLSKSPSKIPKKVEKKIQPKKSPENVTVPLPNPSNKELPYDVPKVLPVMKSSSSENSSCVKDANSLGFAPYKEMGDDKSHLDMFSGPVAFTISPPPSSLPLPTFSLRPKLSCKTEAAGVDTGATDDLRRLLRLQN